MPIKTLIGKESCGLRDASLGMRLAAGDGGD